MLTERVFNEAEAAAQWLADEIAARLRAALAERGRASLMVSGGRSPIPLFRALSRQPLDWSKVWISLVDERWVDSTSADSNERLVRECLLQADAARAQFVPLKNDAKAPHDGIAASAAALAHVPRPFDVVVLGMGEDGHTASLFPDAPGVGPALDPHRKDSLAVLIPPSAPHPRMSLTMAAVLDARWICLQIQGAAKRAVYERAKVTEPAALPIAAVLRQLRVPVQTCLIALQ
jgi:6-phosphogluconolactonase